MGFTIFHADQRDWSTPSAGDQTRGILRLSDAMTQMRANVWRLPAGSSGRRHAEQVQEEVFVVLKGRPTLFLGEPAEPVELTTGSIVVVEPGTPIQVANPSEEDATVFIIGAPPEEARADYLPGAV
jgi:mannose-6-phosphate isomerase-like protein (cupin superfamily)